MTITAVDPATVALQSWRNGRGTTRTLAAGAGWRVSLAELTADGPFSVYPHTERLFTPLGDGFELVIDGAVVPAVRHRPTPFAGEAEVELRGLSSPTQALNVMTARGVWHGEVVMVPADHATSHATGADETVRILLGDHIALVSLHSLRPRTL